ncbi:MAG: serine/threonine protein kinase [Proteobacteria bacterium]|nr:serine/threonine protein kinase [Pseudomonadota bacterium]
MPKEQLETPQQLQFKYRYERILGEGSNGKTFLARDLNTGNSVAIKALKLNQSENFKAFELFKREAQTLSSIHLTGVPHFYESILAEETGGECYIIQEYINAPSVLDYLQKGRVFSENETLLLMHKVAEILDILHTQYSPPVIHRDIKPSNILCTLPDENEKAAWHNIQPYLIDFGAVANAHSNTDKSTIAGTIGYMAPEQNFGECLPQTDFYALGATALHMLTGVPPYEMEFDTFSLKYLEALKEHAPNTSKAMCALLGQLLDYDHTKRPASAKVLLDMLDNMLAGRMPTNHLSKRQRLYQHIHKILLIPYNYIISRSEKIEFNKINAPYIRYTVGTMQRFDRYHIKTETSLHTNKSRTYQNFFYTFNVDGVTWCGIDSQPGIALSRNKYQDIDLENPSPSQRQQLLMSPKQPFNTLYFSLPAKCYVMYKMDDPSINAFGYLILDNDNKE